ncbi:Alpha-(1 3)-fucosyltransferase 7 [Mactra antiquata]
MRQLTRRNGTGFATICLISMMALNFYVNVWVHKDDSDFVLELRPDHTSHKKSRFLWKLAETDDEKSALNTTMKNTLESPLGVLSGPQATYKKIPTSPTFEEVSNVWPSLVNYQDDRILKQLEFIPESVKNNKKYNRDIKTKTILLFNGFRDWGVKPGRETFLEQKCPVNNCELVSNIKRAPEVDAVLFRQNVRFPIYPRPRDQIWMMYFLESPYYTPSLKQFNGHINWTATYRHDSDIVAPYEKFVKYNTSVLHARPHTMKNYAAGKTKKVAWFVSNCKASNSRLEYAKELSKHIDVDIFGRCGDKKCTRGKEECSRMIHKEYKFYLAFENSNCRDYVTEKFFYNGLQHDVIPIVMGAAPEDYRRVAPHYSFIHVDEHISAKELAQYLLELDADDDLYNAYFKWKGTGEFINTFFWCRVCAMLHDTSRAPQSYHDIEEWWRGRDVCIGHDRWGQHIRREPFISDYYRKQTKTLI